MKAFIYSLSAMLLTLFTLTSCQKVIDVQVNTSAAQAVIEGNLTDVRGTQTIKITQSVPYTESNVYPPIQGATVKVSDNAGNNWLFNESQPGLYTFNNIRGVAGRTYTMTVNTTDQKTYTAVSTMPARVALDSVHVRDITFGSTERKAVVAYFNDPPGIANQYRYVLTINGVLSKTVYADDDRLTDGNAIQENLYPRNDEDEFTEIKPGDQVQTEMQCIDKDVFTYWFTLRQQYRGGPGGGSTPGNPPSNISNNALGYFSAHTTQSKKIVVIK
jgi:hypothetical protein